VVWQADLPGMSGTHLHPRDTPGAILSIDCADPPDSWRWAGPAWTGQAAPHGPGGVVALTVEVDDPAKAAARWAELIGCTDTADPPGVALTLDHGHQRVQFVNVNGRDAGGVGGITGITVAGAEPAAGGDRSADIGGVRFTMTEARP
jgi:hypothetical protein